VTSLTGGTRPVTGWGKDAPPSVPARPARRHSGAWPAAAVLAGLALGGLLALAGPGSIEILQRDPAAGSRLSAGTPAWSRLCYRHPPRLGHPHLAFCARVEGRVIYSDVESRETHLLVLGGFHIVIVELSARARRPGWGSHIVAVGPLLRARDGQREVQAVMVRS
jgi:hypothetical protein